MKKTILISAITSILATPVIAAEIGPLTADQRHQQAYDFREATAAENLALPPAAHPDNGDEAGVADAQGQFHKTLPHDANGVVDPTAYGLLLDATATGTFAAWEAVPAGGTAKLANPLAGLVLDLEGRDSHDYGMKAAPALSSAETAAEMVEVYWQSALLDVPFNKYATDKKVAAAATELAGLTDFTGPSGAAALFRGIFPGESTGPYISQFLYKDIPYGPITVKQKYIPYKAGKNFMTSYDEWLNIQNGVSPAESTVSRKSARYIITGRDLATYVHKDFTYQAYQNAALMLLSFGSSAWDDGNPYKTAARQGAFIDLGAGEILDIVARAGNAGLRAAWFQKWHVHRRLRPEAYGGLAQTSPSLLHAQFTSSSVLADVQAMYGNSLLPMAYPEGSPAHPSYPAGHATIAGACVTVLKAFFKDDALVPSPVEPNKAGSKLKTYEGSLTIGEELNKLASNISLGRDWAGVHYRSDGTEGMILGEEVGIAILKDWRNAHPQMPVFTIKKFDGSEIQI